MSNEHLLLIECCKQVFLGGRSEFIKKLITDGINYNYLLQLSLVNRVSPTVYEVLINKNQLSSYFPRDFISELQKRFYITQEENRIKQTALFEILEESNRRKLKPVGIKGASIIYSTYRKFSILRESRDLDILLLEDDIRPFCAMLSEMGYIQGNFSSVDNKITAVTNDRLADFEIQRPNHTWPFYKYTNLTGYALAVEPHRSIIYGNKKYQISTEEIVKSSTSYEINGNKIYIPQLVHELLILCLVAFSDYSSFENMKVKADIRLRTYCDILNLSMRLSNENLWDDFYICFMETNNQFPVYQILSFCEELFDISLVPDDYFSEIKYLNDRKYSIHNMADFSSDMPIGYWNKNFKEIFSDDNRYYHALDIMFCNCINTHTSCVRNLKQKGKFIKLREFND